MKKTLTYIFLLLVLASCGRHESSYKHGPVKGLSVEVLLPTTPIKDQGKTDLCWAYAMLAAVETDRLAMGDSVNLSPLWLERKSLEEQADNAFFTGNPVSLRGTLPEAMRLMQTYGTLAWDAYHPDASIGSSSSLAVSCDGSQDSDLPAPPSSKTTSRKVMQLAKTSAGQKFSLSSFRDKLADMLDSDLGPAPRYVFMLGAEYTPLEFTHSVCMPGDWNAYTSFTHHPFNKPFAVEVVDNRQHHEAMNIPINILYNKVVNSLKHHHPVAWEGCMKEGLKLEKGNIINSNSSVQMLRQRLFERHILTDDHCMAIIGMGHLANGERVFIFKNSWGIHDGNHGLRYMTARQLMLSTIMIMSKE